MLSKATTNGAEGERENTKISAPSSWSFMLSPHESGHFWNRILFYPSVICVYGALISLWRVLLNRYGSAERIRWFLYVQKPEIAFDLVTLPLPTPLFFSTHQTLQDISHLYFPLSQQTGIYWTDDVETYLFSPKSLNIFQLRSCTSTSETLEGGSVRE